MISNFRLCLQKYSCVPFFQLSNEHLSTRQYVLDYMETQSILEFQRNSSIGFRYRK